MTPEGKVNAQFVKRAKQAKALTIKLTPPPIGVPDRLVIIPPGVVVFVELKAEGEHPTRKQLDWHSQARRVGATVVVLCGNREVDNWWNSMTINELL